MRTAAAEESGGCFVTTFQATGRQLLLQGTTLTNVGAQQWTQVCTTLAGVSTVSEVLWMSLSDTLQSTKEQMQLSEKRVDNTIQSLKEHIQSSEYHLREYAELRKIWRPAQTQDKQRVCTR